VLKAQQTYLRTLKTDDYMKKIAIFCGGNADVGQKYITRAKEFVEVLVDAKISIVYGGGSTGIMGAIGDHVVKLNGDIIGVIPEFLVNRELAHRKIKNLHIVNSMQERKKIIFDLADGFVILPGGVGTMDEFFEVVTNAQIGLHGKPCGILNIENYYEPMIHFLEFGIKEGFIDKESKEQIIITNNPKILLDGLLNYKLPDEYQNIRSQVKELKFQPAYEIVE
jgi:uncharacterized protein (TIGR00730 family)